MSKDRFNRRKLFEKASALGATAAVLSFEERALLAYQNPQAGRGPQGDGPPAGQFGRAPQTLATTVNPGPMPMGKLGDLKLSRLIAGHNLVGFQAHSRDLIYVSQLLRAYFTDDKILDTWKKCEEMGINASFLRVEKHMLDMAKLHKQRGGKMQWIAQIVINEQDQTHDIDTVMETVGASAAYIRGLEGDRFWKAGRPDIIAKSIERIQSYKIPVALAAHEIDTLIWSEQQKFPVDFYVKTFNDGKYWSSEKPVTPKPDWKPTEKELAQSEFGTATHDNIWETKPHATTEFFAKVNKPFVAYKVLAAGAIMPRDGFKFALENGADFLSIGMYDFQLAEDVNTIKALVNPKLERKREWASPHVTA